jgi:hypothetical protein
LNHPTPPAAFFLKARRTVFRAGLFAIASFLVFWPPSVLIVSLIEMETGRIEIVPWYIITKGIFAAVISMLIFLSLPNQPLQSSGQHSGPM